MTGPVLLVPMQKIWKVGRNGKKRLLDRSEKDQTATPCFEIRGRQAPGRWRKGQMDEDQIRREPEAELRNLMELSGHQNIFGRRTLPPT